MSRRLIFCLTFTFCFLISVGTISALVPENQDERSYIGTESATSADDAGEEKYIVKEFFGKIAVFKGSDETPVEITDTAVSSLPDYDKQQLKEGVYAYSEKELKRLLEDYCS